MLRPIFFTIATAAISLSVQAEQVTRSMPACASEELLDELISYSTKKDYDGMRQLFTSGKWIRLTQGESVSVIDAGFMVTIIRYKGQKLYTPAEAVR
jgi:hypothetical protein